MQTQVSKGLNVDTIAGQLPAHLQLDMYLQLNAALVQQVAISLEAIAV